MRNIIYDILYIIYCMKTYTFSYNYGEPYKFAVDGDEITMTHNGKKITKGTYDEIMVGNSPKNKMTMFSGGHGSKFNGNTMIGIKGNTITYFSHIVYKFRLMKGENIITFVSPVGNNMVPYPYLITDRHIYFLLEKQYMKLEDIGTLFKKSYKDDPYGEYLYNADYADKKYL